MNRREFIGSGMGALAFASLAGTASAAAKKLAPPVEIGPILPEAAVARNAALSGRRAAYFCDDTIWMMRDLTRQHPKSMFDLPFLSVVKECHEKYGLRMQFNIFYRTDPSYGFDEFTLREMTDAYRDEWQANKDWLKLGFHALQEGPDFPWINADYADVTKIFGMTRGEIERFAGPGVFALGTVPHWCRMSSDGCRALKDLGIRIMDCTFGARWGYDADQRTRLSPHDVRRIERRRKPETTIYWREGFADGVPASICSYNHMDVPQHEKTVNTFNYLRDPVTGMSFKHFFGDAPVLNHCTLETLRARTEKLLGREMLVFSNHEQYFHPDYSSYQPEYADKIRLMSRLMHENGYPFVFLEELAS